MAWSCAVESLPALPVVLQGTCGGCGRGIPVGYLAVVSKWKPREYSTTGQKLNMMVPAVIHCRDCSGQAEVLGKARARKTAPVFMPIAEELTAKDIMVRLWKVISSEPHGSKKLAEMADLEYSDLILEILKKLRAAGKVLLVEGKWSRA